MSSIEGELNGKKLISVERMGLDSHVSGGLGEMLGGLGMSDEEWAALEAEWDAEWAALKADPWWPLPKLQCSCNMGFE